MVTFSCRDLGIEADHVITGKTVDEVAKKAMAHAKEVHGDLLKQMASTPAQIAEMEKTVRSKIKQA